MKKQTQVEVMLLSSGQSSIKRKKLQSNIWIDHFQFWQETAAENLGWDKKQKNIWKEKV